MIKLKTIETNTSNVKLAEDTINQELEVLQLDNEINIISLEDINISGQIVCFVVYEEC